MVKKLLWNAAEIRNELYGLWNEAREGKNNHLSAFALADPAIYPHTRPCKVCSEWDGRMIGINRAIRHFGGRTQEGRRP